MIAGRFLSLLYHTYRNFVRALFNRSERKALSSCSTSQSNFFSNLLFFLNIFYKYNGDGKCEKIRRTQMVKRFEDLTFTKLPK